MVLSRSTLQSLITFCCFVIILTKNAYAKEQLVKMYIYKNAAIGESPYLVQIRDENGKFFCAGALLSTHHVLTAAECFDKIDFNKAVVVGAATKLSDEGVQRHIENVKIHPLYNAEHKFPNVAVLKLSEPMESDDFYFSYLPLSDRPIEASVYPTTFGWRHFVESLTSEERELYQLRYSLAAEDVCKSEFNIASDSPTFCLIGDDYDGHYCVEDLGSPAIYRRKLVGVASSAKNCKTPRYYVAYTDVHAVRSFIEEAMH